MTTEAAKPASAAPFYVPAFDAFRGFAVMAIVVIHLMFRSQWVPESDVARSVFVSGFLAVDVFFLISGFVLFLPVAVRGTLGDTRAFFIRRYMRIAPAYYVCIALTLLLLPLLLPDPSSPGLPPHDALATLVHVLFLQNEVGIAYGPFYPGFGVNAAVWTLSIEIIFYALLPLVAVWYRRHPFTGLAIAALVTVCWRLALEPPHDYLRNTLAPSDLHQIFKQFPMFTLDFAAGMTAAVVYVSIVTEGRLDWFRRRATPIAVVTCLALLVALVVTGGRMSGSRDHLVIAGAAFHEPVMVAVAFPLLFAVFALAASLAARWVQWPLTNPGSRKLGDLAYGIYLYHLPLIAFAATTLGFARGGSFGDLLLYAVFTIPLALGLGWLSLVLVESPARSWGRNLARRLRSAPASDRPAPAQGPPSSTQTPAA